MSLSPLEDPRGDPYRAEAADLFATNAVGIFSFTILVYDHILTFPDEIQVIWKRPKGSSSGILIYLFIILRYIAPLGFTVQLCSFLLPQDIWTKEICSRYVVFEGCMTVTGLGLVALMMMLRVYALYGRDKRILALLVALFVFQFTVQGWLLSFGQAVVRSPGISPAGCSMIFHKDAGYWATASAWFPIVYDFVIFALTAYKTFSMMRSRKLVGTGGDWIMRTLLRDGSLYFLVILLANVPLILMIATAPPGVQNIMAQFAFLITVTLMCRITLSLRREDASWDIGMTVGQGQTTLFFNDPCNPNPAPHEYGDSRMAIMKRLGTDEWYDDVDVDLQPWQSYASGSSNATLTPARLPARPSGSDLASSRPSPIAEEDPDSDTDYFDPRRRRRRGAGDDAESDVASSRVVNLFRTYSQSSVAEVAAVTGSRHTDRPYDTY